MSTLETKTQTKTAPAVKSVSAPSKINSCTAPRLFLFLSLVFSHEAFTFLFLLTFSSLSSFSTSKLSLPRFSATSWMFAERVDVAVGFRGGRLGADPTHGLLLLLLLCPGLPGIPPPGLTPPGLCRPTGGEEKQEKSLIITLSLSQRAFTDSALGLGTLLDDRRR